MLLRANEMRDIWERIKESAAASPDAITLLILVALDVDALAACAMLTRLLENDEISHNVKPLRDYGNLSEIFVDDIADSAELRNIVLINCGSVYDLLDHLQARLDHLDGGRLRGVEELPDPDCRWFVIDSHRPFHLQNASCGEKLTLLHSDDEASELLDELLAQEHILNDEEFADEEEDEHEPPSQRRRISEDEYRQMSPDSRANQYHELKHLERQYYQSSWHSTSSAVLLYTLVRDLNKSSNDQLWLAATGLTDQLVHERIFFEKYTTEAQYLQGEVAALNPGDMETREVQDTATGASVSVSQHVSGSMRIESTLELRLTLLRHWSLYEALSHSSYIHSRLGLYNSKGMMNLDVWLARMGIPLEECKQAYAYMSKEYRDSLFDLMLQYGSEFGLMHLTYPSFRRVTSYTATVTAADLVYCVDAQLDHSAVDGDSEADGKDAAGAAFSLALSTLSQPNAKEFALKKGIERAKKLLRVLVSQGSRIITQRMYQDLSDFYQVVLKRGLDTEHFTKTQPLTKLALFVADALREGRKTDDPKPLLIAAPNVNDKTHLVVAVLGSARHWRGSGENSFGAAFDAAARDPHINARVAHESFESSVCIVASDDLDNFLEGVAMNYDPNS